MSSEEKSKLILMLQDMLAQARQETKEVFGRLDVFLESQSSANKTIDEMKEMISGLRKELAEKDNLIADLREALERLSSEHYGSRSQKGGTTRKVVRQKSRP